MKQILLICHYIPDYWKGKAHTLHVSSRNYFMFNPDVTQWCYNSSNVLVRVFRLHREPTSHESNKLIWWEDCYLFLIRRLMMIKMKIINIDTGLENTFSNEIEGCIIHCFNDLCLFSKVREEFSRLFQYKFVSVISNFSGF